MANLSAQRKEAIYREVEMQYLTQDAKNHITDRIEQVEDDLENETSLLEYKRLKSLDDSDYACLAEYFRDDHDCNIADNVQWDNLIDEYIEDLEVSA